MEKENIARIQDIKKTIEIKNKIEEKRDMIFGILCFFYFILYTIFFTVFVVSFKQTEFFFHNEYVSKLMLLLSLVITSSISFVLIFMIANYKAKKIYKNEINKIRKYMPHSIYELAQLRSKEINKLIIKSTNDYKLFSFIVLNIDDKELKKELLNCYCNEDILKIICDDINLLSIISDLPRNKETDCLIKKVKDQLKKEKQEEKERKLFKISINNKRKNKIEQEEIKIL